MKKILISNGSNTNTGEAQAQAAEGAAAETTSQGGDDSTVSTHKILNRYLQLEGLTVYRPYCLIAYPGCKRIVCDYPIYAINQSLLL